MYKNKMFFFTNSKGQLTRHTSSKKETMWKKNYFSYNKSQVNVASQILIGAIIRSENAKKSESLRKYDTYLSYCFNFCCPWFLDFYLTGFQWSVHSFQIWFNSMNNAWIVDLSQRSTLILKQLTEESL